MGLSSHFCVHSYFSKREVSQARTQTIETPTRTDMQNGQAGMVISFIA